MTLLNLNTITIWDANFPLSVDEFFEEFAGMVIASLIDYFSGYDQVELAIQSRDKIAFMTPLGLMRMTRLLQKATNLVPQFCCISSKILKQHIPKWAYQFVDDIGVKVPWLTYDNKKTAPGVWKSVLEHIQSLDQVLADIERAGVIIADAKSHFCIKSLKVVGYICGHLNSTKVIKILDWPEPTDITGARAFLSVYVYYRIWIERFAIIAEPISLIMQKRIIFR